MAVGQLAVNFFDRLFGELPHHRRRIGLDGLDQFVIGARIAHLAQREDRGAAARRLVGLVKIFDYRQAAARNLQDPAHDESAGLLGQHSD